MKPGIELVPISRAFISIKTNFILGKGSVFSRFKNLKGVESFFYHSNDTIAAQLTIAHMLDHVVCLLKNKEVVDGKEKLDKM